MVLGFEIKESPLVTKINKRFARQIEKTFIGLLLLSMNTELVCRLSPVLSSQAWYLLSLDLA